MEFIGLDLGNGDIKVASSEVDSALVFPAIVGDLPPTMTQFNLGTASKIDNMSVKIEGREYAIGNMALKNSAIRTHDATDGKYLAESTMVLAQTAIGLTAKQPFSTCGLVIGLPIHKMNIANQVEDLYRGQKFGGKIGYCRQYETVTNVMRVDNTIVVPQPHGTLFNLILDDNGEITDRALASSGVAIFDIGYKTNDGVVFKNLDPIGRLTIHSKSGMHVAYEEIKNEISEHFNGLEVKAYEVPEIIRTGHIKGNNVQVIVNQALYNLASSIINEIKTKWEDAWEIDTYIFTGGGSELLKPYLASMFDEPVFASQSANAEGFLKYAKRMWGRTS